MECRQKRPNPVNKQGSVSDSRPSRSSFRIRKTRKQKGTQTEDVGFSSSSSSSSATSESCSSSSDDEQQLTTHDKLSHHHHHHHPQQQRHTRKSSSLKHRKPVLSDSNDEYYYTHPPSPQQQITTTILPATVVPVAQQLIPRGPLICSDSFEKWNDRSFTWNRPLPPPTLLSSAPSTSTGTSESTTSITTTTKSEISEQNKHQTGLLYGQASFLEGDVSDIDDDPTHFIQSNKISRTTKTVTCKDIGLITSPTLENESSLPSIKIATTTNFGSNQNLNIRKLSLTESLRSLPTNSDTTQNEIFQRLRQAEEVRYHYSLLFFHCVCELKEKKRLEVENRAMKQELVRTKSKISSLKREMSSIQQLHHAQQHVQGQLSAPTIISSRQELEQHHRQNHLSPSQAHLQPSVFTYPKENLDRTNSHHHHHRKTFSTSSNDESLSPPVRITVPTCSVQSTQTSSRSPPSTISQFSNLLSTTTLTNPYNNQQKPRRSLNLTPSSRHCDPSASPSDEQLRLYLTETLQREKDSAV